MVANGVLGTHHEAAAATPVEEGRKQSGRIKPRQAQPIQLPTTGDQRGSTAVPDDGKSPTAEGELSSSMDHSFTACLVVVRGKGLQDDALLYLTGQCRSDFGETGDATTRCMLVVSMASARVIACMLGGR